jgi:opacity protein-like surface antigen
MKKMTQSILATLAMVGLLYADEITVGDKFIGAEVGYNTVQGGRYMIPTDATTYNEFYKGENVEFGVRIGAQNEDWKSTVLFDYFDSKDDDQNTEKLMLLVDYTLWKTELDSVKLMPYLGANIGYMNYESSYIEDNGFLYGTQAGLMMSLSDIIQIDLTYRYSLTNMDTVDHAETVMFGVNYLY